MINATAAQPARRADLRLPGLVHDLNNVFQTLVEVAELLSADVRSEFLSAAILRSVERGKNLTAGLESLEGTGASFEAILNGAILFVQDSLIGGRGPTILFLREIEPGIELQRNWAWERVLINLFSNAVRAMPAGGTIHISARRKGLSVENAAQGGAIEIVVRDDGRGIAPDILPVIFEPHVSTSGSGLGLHIVRTIVKQDGGEIRAANRVDGRGAEFTITILRPLERNELPAEPAVSVPCVRR
jgi:signal transduction histidine kinase